MTITTVRVKQDTKGQYYWVGYASNGEEIDRSSESYDAYSYAAQQAAMLHPDATVLRTEGTKDVAVISMPEDGGGSLHHDPIDEDYSKTEVDKTESEAS